jgi:DNA repair protein RadC
MIYLNIKNMKIKEIPWYNRPYYKLKKNGAQTLDDAQLLAIIFGRGNKEFNAIDLSNKLLNKYNLHKLNSLSIMQLNNILGNEVKAIQILALTELFSRYNKLKDKAYQNSIKCPEDVYNIFKEELKNKKKEFLYELILDSKNNIITKKLISIGTLNSSLIHPREVFKPAIKYSANMIILVHNHPSGDTTPSKEDIEVTKILYELGEKLNIALLDHIIIGDGYKSVLNEII